MPEILAHLMLATPNRGWLEWTDLLEPILKDPFAVEQGAIIFPEKPGFDFDWDENALSCYKIQETE